MNIFSGANLNDEGKKIQEDALNEVEKKIKAEISGQVGWFTSTEGKAEIEKRVREKYAAEIEPALAGKVNEMKAWGEGVYNEERADLENKFKHTRTRLMKVDQRDA